MPDPNNPYDVRVGDVYQSNDVRSMATLRDPHATYQQPPFMVRLIDDTYAYVQGGRYGNGRRRRIRLDRLKPNGKAGYTRLSRQGE